jgi:predicted TIM-barrel fold metal-dependent hydrolase
MDAAGVERAAVICARIGDNPRNVDDAFAAASRHPGRLVVLPDLESRWSADYGTPGAEARLEEALTRWEFRAFTLYLDEKDDGGWLTGAEGRAFFALAAARRLVLSLSIVPHQVEAAIALAQAFPTLPILLHHLGFLGPRTAATPNALERVLAAAARPNIHVKFSGMGNVAPEQEFPYPALQRDVIAPLVAAFGPARMIWGSDYPVSRRHMTYRQTLSMAVRHGGFAESDLPAVLGGNLLRLLGE